MLTREHKEERLGHITASRVDPLLGSPRSKSKDWTDTAESYLMQKLHEIVTGEVEEEFDSRATKWGNKYEPIALAEYEQATGVTVERVGFVPHPIIPLCGCSPDGLIGTDGMVQTKCPFNGQNHMRTAKYKVVPKKYIAQVQMELWVCGRKWNDYVSFDPRVKYPWLRLVIVRVERDVEVMERIEDAVNRGVEWLLQSLTELKLKLVIGGDGNVE